MIAANELRLGNLVLASSLWEGQYFNVIELYAEECAVSPEGKSQSRIVKYDELAPISLDYNLLEDFGFKAVLHGPGPEAHYLLHWQSQQGFYLNEAFQPVQSLQNPFHIAHQPIAFFHQLQNLFFAVTGRDLSVFASLR
ncbi:MAG: hypothetical protein MUD08_04110 [Cytophagales bacterium]|jgi:hypothetical protein|nr:hypothetical protein [Cytophagales bacterium]